MINISFFQDRRNLYFIYNKFRWKKSNILPKKIYFCFSVDVEYDSKNCFSFTKTQKIIDFISKYGYGTFFLDPSVLNKQTRLDFKQNEIGSHSFRHSAFGDDWWIKKEDHKMPVKEALDKSVKTIEHYYNISPVSFRAPKFSLSKKNLVLIKEKGFFIDSSESPHSPFFISKKHCGLLRIPVSRIPNPLFKFNKGIPYLFYYSLMSSLLFRDGIDFFVEKSKEMVAYQYEYIKEPILVFNTHNWELNDSRLKLLSDYFKKLTTLFEVEFISLKEYHTQNIFLH